MALDPHDPLASKLMSFATRWRIFDLVAPQSHDACFQSAP